MSNDGILILGSNEVDSLLAGRETEVIEIVESAYVAHQRGESSLPHSTFLRFPGDDTNRIIALPAFLGDGFDVAGMKWISSFPGNVRQGMERASAVLILNSRATGRPETILEGSIISARRTAASAAAAARVLLAARTPERVGLVGTGVINLEVARSLRAALPAVHRFLLFDLDAARAGRFAASLREILGEVEVAIAGSLDELLAASPLVSFATTALRPYVSDLSACVPGAVLLHVSLRDLTPEAILACDNVVDDPDHVCRAQTSVHLAEQATGGRDFIRCTLADILQGAAPARRGDGSIAVFSPFGLGVLDIAVGARVAGWAREAGRGTFIPSFLPAGQGETV
ncbi:MAG TPA: 2,3-diaminopropionate biosynthesis protein SbnB [Thermoanaerobaculia bacterium]|jgi:ornithine cyclodeaminase|nr:2,3-diaminopropionate biosynthesis protein SbnB [Thermoanaerobaculia bacterium]